MPNPPARISSLLRAVVRRVLHPDFFSSVYVWRALAPGPASPSCDVPAPASGAPWAAEAD
jgi:cobalamin biosynthesis protein CobD/CbiB